MKIRDYRKCPLCEGYSFRVGSCCKPFVVIEVDDDDKVDRGKTFSPRMFYGYEKVHAANVEAAAESRLRHNVMYSGGWDSEAHGRFVVASFEDIEYPEDEEETAAGQEPIEIPAGKFKVLDVVMEYVPEYTAKLAEY